MRTDPELDAAVPECTAIEYRGLVESIATHGYLPASEVVLTQGDEVLLDGRSRLKACAELGTTPEFAYVNVPPEKRWDYVVVINLRRRHLTIDQRRDILRQYLHRHPEMTNRAAAAATGVSHPTVAAVREEEGLASPRRAPRNGKSFHSDEAEDDGTNDALQDAADHRNQVCFELTFNYPCESDQARTRGKLEYALPSERVEWNTGRQYLVTPAPADDADFAQLLRETMQRCQRIAIDRPLRTMRRVKALA